MDPAYRDLIGKKLLVIGSAECDANIVRAAQELGVYVIVADGTPKSAATFAKNLADESWDMDYSRTEEIGEKCKATGVNGVLAGYSEFRVSAACKIAKFIGSPFYATEEQIELTSNKRSFKEECRKYGIRVPKDFQIQTEDSVDNVCFPVIVKPTDAAGRKGITICHIREELDQAVQKALRYSVSKNVVVEEYVVGMEFVVVYTLQDDKISLSCFNEKYLNQELRQSGLCDLALTPSRYLEQYLNQADANVRDFLHGIKAENGVAFFQGIATQDDIFIFEMGYRLNGGNDYFIAERENGISYMKMLIAHSLTGRMIGNLERDNPYFSKYYANYLLYAKAGKIGRIEFCGDVQKQGIGDVHIKKSSGSIIKGDGTTEQGVFSFKLIAATLQELCELLGFCRDHAIILDENGNDMLIASLSISDFKLKNQRVIE